MLSALASDFFSQSPVLLLPVVALLIFMVVFTVMAVRAFRMPDEAVNEVANLPLMADTEAHDG